MAKVSLMYKNYKGVTSLRTVEVLSYRMDVSEYHGTKPTELMYVWCYDKEDFRDFAVKDIVEFL